MSQSRLIVVLGMHRSGTSVTTHILHALGVALSDDLMAPTGDNAKGYFESREIARLHDEILAKLGMEWTTSGLTVSLPPNWWLAPEIAPLKAELASIAGREMERHGGLWGFKDPRTARVLPVWRAIVAELECDVRFVLVSRHPTDVAKSLMARDHIEPFHAEALWLDHYADAVLNAPQIDAYVEYRRWLEDPVEQAGYMMRALGLDWNGSRADLESITRDVVSPELRHHATTLAAFKLPFTAPFYDALVRRDADALKSIAGIYNVARGFTQIALANLSQGGYQRLLTTMPKLVGEQN
jgi:hypothetical protein